MKNLLNEESTFELAKKAIDMNTEIFEKLLKMYGGLPIEIQVLFDMQIDLNKMYLEQIKRNDVSTALKNLKGENIILN